MKLLTKQSTVDQSPQHTWHADIKVCELDFNTITPLEELLLLSIRQTHPEILLRPKTNQTDEKRILKPDEQTHNIGLFHLACKRGPSLMSKSCTSPAGNINQTRGALLTCQFGIGKGFTFHANIITVIAKPKPTLWRHSHHHQSVPSTPLMIMRIYHDVDSQQDIQDWSCVWSLQV